MQAAQDVLKYLQVKHLNQMQIQGIKEACEEFSQLLLEGNLEKIELYFAHNEHFKKMDPNYSAKKIEIGSIPQLSENEEIFIPDGHFIACERTLISSIFELKAKLQENDKKLFFQSLNHQSN